MNFYKHTAYIGFVDKETKNKKKYKQQFDEEGFDDSVTWSLDESIIKFILPRLKRYHEIAFKVIEEPDLEKDCELMIEGFELYLSDCEVTEEVRVKINNALELLVKNFHKLWW